MADVFGELVAKIGPSFSFKTSICGCTPTISRVLIAGMTASPRIRPKFVSRAVEKWAYLHQARSTSADRGKLADNALVESFNASLEDECLNTN